MNPRLAKTAGTTAQLALLALLACSDTSGHEHDDQHGHGHGDQHKTSITQFTDATELFVEMPPLIVGQTAAFAVHVTELIDFRALQGGTLQVELTGGDRPAERLPAVESSAPGVFRVTLTPAHAGLRTPVMHVRAADIDVVHRLPTVTVFSNVAAAASASHDHENHQRVAEQTIVFSKRQQWHMAFATEPVQTRQIRRSFEAYATIRARADGQVRLVAPVDGRISSGRLFSHLGAKVERGDALVALTPQLADTGDTAALQQAVERTRIELEHAEVDEKRLQSLLADGAVPERRAIEAGFETRKARAAHETARKRLQQARTMGSARARKRGAMQVRAPVAGTVVSIDTVAGAVVAAGAPLAHIIDLERLWLEVHVAETHASYLAAPRGVWFEIDGFDDTFSVGPDALVTVGGVVDSRSRTIPLVMAIDNPDGRLRVGMFAQAHVLVDDPYQALAVPVTAVLHEAGLPVVYLQSGGESFQRRSVQVGARDGAFIEIRAGLRAGERVVTRGAYAVRLAASSSQLPAHGHAH